MILHYSIFSFLIAYVLSKSPCQRDWIFSSRINSCYYVALYPLTWQNAERYCMNRESHLLSIHSQEEDFAIQDLVSVHNPQFLTWLGLAREQNSSASNFRWTDAQPISFSHFFENEPTGKGDCVAVADTVEQRGWKTIDCYYEQFFFCKKNASGPPPKVFTAPSGQFSSPNYPRNYGDNTTSNYFIELEPNSRILLTIEELQSEANVDMLDIFDGPNENAVQLARLSGSHSNRSFLLWSNMLMLRFQSDGEDNSKGFKANYLIWHTPEVEKHEERSGELSSDNYPYQIAPFTMQKYEIRCPDDHVVQVKIRDFLTSPDDFLEIRTHADELIDNTRRFSGGLPNLPFSIDTSSSAMEVNFESKEYPAIDSRWRLTYECVGYEGSFMGDEVIID